MNDYTRKNMRNRKRRIERRPALTDQVEPMFSGATFSTRWESTRGTSVGGIGTMQLGAADRADRSHRPCMC